MNARTLSRRDFLKLSGLGLASLSLPALKTQLEDPFSAQQGRVTARMIWMYDRPSINGTELKILTRDALIDIANTALSDDPNDPNRVWYQIGADDAIQGFVYSGTVQPVKTVLNDPQPTLDIPQEGLVSQVTVPYTDARVDSDSSSKVAYRMYYESTHWIRAVTTNAAGEVWYQVYDDKWDKYYYARSEHLHVFSAEELSPISADVPNKYKRVQVVLSQQLLTAYEYDLPVFITPVSSGATFRSGIFKTPTGSFITYYKRASRHMAAGDLASSGFDLPGVPWVQYIKESGLSLHGTYWHNDFGRPRSHGCVNLPSEAAKWLFRWTTPSVALQQVFAYGSKGTRVDIDL